MIRELKVDYLRHPLNGFDRRVEAWGTFTKFNGNRGRRGRQRAETDSNIKVLQGLANTFGFTYIKA